MNISNFPKAPMVKDDKKASDEWIQYFDQTTQQLQQFLSDERYVLPSQDHKNVAILNTNSGNVGSILYNNESKSGQINTEGTYKNLVTYEEMTDTQVNAIPSGQRNGRIIYETNTGDLKIGFNDEFKTVSVT